ncbi:cysteine desulfurase [Planifilum fimeticola]|jgi:cysteine desulfurase|uniref:cysteine desulfurase n=1 Tax=Planifilum fimeticola TaxID=201975 RepID=A0A2T0LEI6_9BACL|nr:cysteine desulfurase family protein [Planifilum fimeticola]PRX40538.1 cysteine desulfurase [Planifilum fimeticola]
MAIYLDHAATTPVHPEVRQAMLPYLDDYFGNPSSMHRFGRAVRQAVDEARDKLAGVLGAEPGEIVFTSGGTEADNFALIGAALSGKKRGKDHLITSAVEHHAVLDTCRHLERLGFRVTYLPVDETGEVRLDALREAIDDRTALVSVMYGNNEVGTLQPVEAIGELARENGALFHTDAVQAFGYEPLNVRELPVDLLSVSSHKINGPKGVGALYVAKGVSLTPHMYGGSQEMRRRAGTENVPGIVGFGKAAEIAGASRAEHLEQARRCREAMIRAWEREGIDFVVNGHPHRHLPHILNVSFPGAETETLLMNLDLEGIACSSGSACTSGTLEVSHVLKAMNLPEAVLRSAIRFSFGRGNTVEEVTRAAETAARIVRRLTGKKAG